MVKLKYGKGLNDANYTVQTKIGGSVVTCPFYRRWCNMLHRVYSLEYHSKHPSYIGCSVENEWLSLMSFRKWMMIQEWHGKELDKDILFKDNKVYGPNTCVFVDKEVNYFLLDSRSSRGEFSIGVSLNKKTGKYLAQMGRGKDRYLGLYETEEEAHQAWYNAKKQRANEIASRQVDKRVAKAIIDRFL